MRLSGRWRDAVNVALVALVLGLLLLFLRSMGGQGDESRLPPAPTMAPAPREGAVEYEEEVERDPSSGLLVRASVGLVGAEYSERSVSVELEPLSSSPPSEAHTKNKEGAVPLLSMEGPFEVSRGVLTGSVRKAVFTLSSEGFDQLIGSRLEFTVLGTNGNGRLIIRLNGNVIWSQVTQPGEHAIDPMSFADLLRDGENVVELDASSSGWRVWAPTSYIIARVDLASSTGQVVADEKRFSLTRQMIKGWTKGRLSFTVAHADTSGELAISINGYTVFSGRVREKAAPPYTIDFSLPRAVLHPTNTLTVSAGEGGSYALSNLELIVFYSPQVLREASYDFNITDEELESLKRGARSLALTVDVTQVPKPGWLTVYVMNREGSRSIVKGPARQGPVSLEITPTYIISGHNNIQLVSNGTVHVSYVEVKLR